VVTGRFLKTSTYGDKMAKEVICPPCGEAMRAENDDELVRAVQEHAEREHSTTLTAEHILKSAREV